MERYYFASKWSLQAASLLSESRSTQKLLKQQEKALQAQKEAQMKAKQTQLLKEKDHRIPEKTASEIEQERKLKKLATRGVIQLFNAISKQQKATTATEDSTTNTTVGSRTGKTDVIKDKQNFLNMLKQQAKK